MVNPRFHSEKCFAYINSIEDFKVYTELGRDKGTGFDEFLKMGRAVSFEDIGKGFDEVWSIGMKIKKENENLSIRLKPVSIKEPLKIFVFECEKECEKSDFDFIEWLREKEDFWNKVRINKVTEINSELEKAKGERVKKLKLRRMEAINMCTHYCKIIELVRTDVLNGVILPSVKPPKRKDAKPLLSFKWESTPEKELPELYNKMEGQFIDNTTTLEQFKSIFTGQPTKSLTPVKWIETNVLLAYFLSECFKGENFAAIGSNLFLKKNGEPFKASDLTQAKRDNKKYGKPKGYEKIDKILKAIQKTTLHT